MLTHEIVEESGAKELLAPVWARYTAVVADHAEGCYIYDAQGEVLMGGLRTLQEQYPFIGDVRGLGLMAAAELVTPDGAPDGARVKALLKACEERGLILLNCGPWDQVVRFVPPLIVTTAQSEDALGIVEAALAAEA